MPPIKITYKQYLIEFSEQQEAHPATLRIFENRRLLLIRTYKIFREVSLLRNEDAEPDNQHAALLQLDGKAPSIVVERHSDGQFAYDICRIEGQCQVWTALTSGSQPLTVRQFSDRAKFILHANQPSIGGGACAVTVGCPFVFSMHNNQCKFDRNATHELIKGRIDALLPQLKDEIRATSKEDWTLLRAPIDVSETMLTLYSAGELRTAQQLLRSYGRAGKRTQANYCSEVKTKAKDANLLTVTKSLCASQITQVLALALKPGRLP